MQQNLDAAMDDCMVRRTLAHAQELSFLTSLGCNTYLHMLMKFSHLVSLCSLDVAAAARSFGADAVACTVAAHAAQQPPHQGGLQINSLIQSKHRSPDCSTAGCPQVFASHVGCCFVTASSSQLSKDCI